MTDIGYETVVDTLFIHLITVTALTYRKPPNECPILIPVRNMLLYILFILPLPVIISFDTGVDFIETFLEVKNIRLTLTQFG